jgi:hypothetical protein
MTKPNLLFLFFLLSLGLAFPQAYGQINITQPATGASVIACTNYVLYYTPTSSGFSSYVVVEVHQNNSSGPIVKTYTNVSGGIYLAQGYSNSVNSTGLVPGNYQIKIYDYYNPSFNGWSGIFTIAPLSTPGTLTCGYNQGTTFGVNWPTVFGVSEYRVDVSTTSDFSNILPTYNNKYAFPSEASGFYVSGLTAGTSYWIRVRGVNSCNTSPNSPALQVTTCSPPTTAPLATGVMSVTATSFIADWNGVAGVSQYILTVTRAGQAPVNYTVDNATEFLVSPVNPSTNYTYKVKSVLCGQSPESNVIPVTTLALGVPVITMGSGDSDERWASWSTVPGAVYYHFQVSEEEDFTPIWDEIEKTGTSHTFDAYFCDDYYLRVRAKSQTGGYSAWSAVTHWPGGAGCRVAAGSSVARQEENIALTISTFPNPVDSYVNIILPNEVNLKSAELHVWNSVGHEIILPVQRLTENLRVDATSLPTGFYLVTINQGTRRLRTKFIKK